jgi:hypothetical protein
MRKCRPKRKERKVEIVKGFKLHWEIIYGFEKRQKKEDGQ